MPAQIEAPDSAAGRVIYVTDGFFFLLLLRVVVKCAQENRKGAVFFFSFRSDASVRLPAPVTRKNAPQARATRNVVDAGCIGFAATRDIAFYPVPDALRLSKRIRKEHLPSITVVAISGVVAPRFPCNCCSSSSARLLSRCGANLEMPQLASWNPVRRRFDSNKRQKTLNKLLTGASTLQAETLNLSMNLFFNVLNNGRTSYCTSKRALL